MIISLLTDFGLTDPFVGIMKGIIAGINPNATVVDLTHGVAPQNVLGAALILRYAAAEFPPGSIHVAVVDPGVGGDRRPLLIEADGSYYIGPDNGVLSLATTTAKSIRIIHLSNPKFHRKPISSTFHGRDIFAPVAAHVSRSIDIEALGDTSEDFTRLEWPQARRTSTGLEARIIYIDGFGNLFTNITEPDLFGIDRRSLKVRIGDRTLHGMAANYAAVDPGGYAALINSWGLLEIAVNRGNAMQQTGAKLGDKVQISVS